MFNNRSRRRSNLNILSDTIRDIVSDTKDAPPRLEQVQEVPKVKGAKRELEMQGSGFEKKVKPPPFINFKILLTS